MTSLVSLLAVGCCGLFAGAALSIIAFVLLLFELGR